MMKNRDSCFVCVDCNKKYQVRGRYPGDDCDSEY
jgi:hypothetical protein